MEDTTLHFTQESRRIEGCWHYRQNILLTYLTDYSPDDIYNADETGLYYRTLPDGTLCSKTKRLQGSKDRITAMICTNMTGTDKRQLLVIGKSKQPRCFHGKSLPVTYLSNSNAWMTSAIFTDFIQQVDRDMRLQRWHIVLFVDNCSAHPPSSADKRKNTKMVFLPPNTTSVIQPCDQGIIKGHCRGQVIHTIINDIDNDDISAKTLARKLYSSWRRTHGYQGLEHGDPTTIRNCFS